MQFEAVFASDDPLRVRENIGAAVSNESPGFLLQVREIGTRGSERTIFLALCSANLFVFVGHATPICPVSAAEIGRYRRQTPRPGSVGIRIRPPSIVAPTYGSSASNAAPSKSA